jgi:hypothetical protein
MLWPEASRASPSSSRSSSVSVYRARPTPGPQKSQQGLARGAPARTLVPSVSRCHPVWLLLLLLAGCVRLGACPSKAGGPCDPRDANCPKSYGCALGAEVCTRECAATEDCWVKVEDGCRSDELPLMRLPDGGTFSEQSADGFCPETKRMVCLGGWCQRDACRDGGCRYDEYGPSPFKGNRSQGPAQ